MFFLLKYGTLKMGKCITAYYVYGLGDWMWWIGVLFYFFHFFDIPDHGLDILPPAGRAVGWERDACRGAGHVD